jgi:hypothetical protein
MSATQSLAHPLHPGSAEMDTAVKRYIARCILLLDRAFGRNYEVRDAFTRWANEKFQKSEDPVLLLHENPLYFSARYLGIDPLAIDSAILQRAEDLAHKRGW